MFCLESLFIVAFSYEQMALVRKQSKWYVIRAKILLIVMNLYLLVITMVIVVIYQNYIIIHGRHPAAHIPEYKMIHLLGCVKVCNFSIFHSRKCLVSQKILPFITHFGVVFNHITEIGRVALKRDVFLSPLSDYQAKTRNTTISNHCGFQQNTFMLKSFLTLSINFLVS